MYTSAHRKPGTGTWPGGYDPSTYTIRNNVHVFKHNNVARIYLEYCEIGDMLNYIYNETRLESLSFRGYRLHGLRFPNACNEGDIWKVWKCLATGLCKSAFRRDIVPSF